MYGATEQVIIKKNAYEGVVREKQNYLMYEDVDETQKYKKKRPVYRAKRPEPIFDPLDNYRYYEDLTLRDRRRRSIVKHERTSKPVGRETPFLRDSFKKHIVNKTIYTPVKSNLRSFSNEGNDERRPKTKYSALSPSLEHHTYICYPYKKKRLYTAHGESYVQHERESPNNYNIIRQLSPKNKNQNKPKLKPNKNKLRGKITNIYLDKEFDIKDNFNYKYKYKQGNKLKSPKRKDPQSNYRKRNDRSSSFGKEYRNQPRFDEGFTCQTSSSFYCPLHGYQ